MRLAVASLEADVMARLGEKARQGSTGSSAGVPWPEDVVALKIGALLPEQGAALIKEAPHHMLGSGVSLTVSPTWRLMPCGLYAAEIPLPEGFLRLVAAKMSGWRGSVYSLIGPDNAGWSRQWSTHMGIAGCPEWPRAYLDSSGGGPLLRLVGSVEADCQPERLGVWSVPSVSSDGKFDFPEPLYPALVGAIAGKI